MPRMMGVDIPNDKQIQYSMTYLYGVGLYLAREICEKLSIDPTRPASDLSEEELSRISTMLERDYTVEGPLRRQVLRTLAVCEKSNVTAAFGTALGLPVRGQRTKTNARTRKGRAKPSPARRASRICDSDCQLLLAGRAVDDGLAGRWGSGPPSRGFVAVFSGIVAAGEVGSAGVCGTSFLTNVQRSIFS
jgi:small subunit ribosomal protein S13